MKKIFFLLCFALLGLPSAWAQRFEDFKAYSRGQSGITCVKYNLGGTAFAAGNAQGIIALREVARDSMPDFLHGHTAEINHLSFHPNGMYLISTDVSGVLNVWDLKSKKTVYSITAKEIIKDGDKPIFTFAYFSIDGQAMVFGGSEGEIYVNRPLSANTNPGLIFKHNNGFTCADYYYDDGNYLAIGSKDEVQLLDYFTKKVLKVMKTCNGWVQDVRYNHDGTEIGCLCDDGNFTVWNIETDAKVRTWMASPPGPSTELAYSKDGNYLVIGDSRGTPKVYDAKNGKLLSSLLGHRQSVRSVDFHPSGKYIITGANDRLIKVWRWKKTFDEAIIPDPPPTPPTPPATPQVPQKTDPPIIAAQKNKTEPIAELPPPVTHKQQPKQNTDTPPTHISTDFKRRAEQYDTTRLDNKLTVFDTVKLKFNARGIPDSLGDRRVNTGKKEFVRTDVIEVSVYDQEVEDGDIISLYFNGEWVLKEYTLKPIKRKITLHLDPDGDNHLVVYAHNLGTRPPNTVAVTVFDGKDERKLALSSSLRNSDSVNFRVNKTDE